VSVARRTVADKAWYPAGRARLDPRTAELARSPAAGGGVDVVLPVHGGEQHLSRLVPSLLRHTDLRRHRLVVVVDGPQPEAVEQRLGRLRGEAGDALCRIDRPRNAGFAATANDGMRCASDRDVVLLNTDTVVAAGWLDKLQRAAYSAPEIATATSLSNRATICSVPRGNVDNDLPAGHDADSFAALVERVARREYPRLPTGVGMCLYIKRAALARLGLFDEAAFPEGYGEETEWCFRALRAGWEHVADDTTFVFHAGRGSYGPRRRRLAQRAGRRMRRMHPGFERTLTRFLAEDPLRAVRGRILEALAPSRSEHARSRPRVLHVVHGLPPDDYGGTELYAYWLARQQARERPTVVYTRRRDPGAPHGEAVESLDGALRVRRVANDFDQRDPLARNALYDRRLQRDFASLLADERPDIVHVHHLAGHGLALAGAVRARGLPLVLQLQDWWTSCARANLLDAGERLCSGPGIWKCARCLPLTALPPRPITNATLHAVRRRLARRLVASAAAVIAGSSGVVEAARRLGLPDRTATFVLPYGSPLGDQPAPAARAASGARLPLRVGFVGSLLPHKGAHVLAEACRCLPQGALTVDLWGDETFSPEYVSRVRGAAGSTTLRFRGRFEEGQRAAVLAEMDVLVVPSLGRESFGLAGWEAMHLGVPVVCSDRLPFADTVTAAGCGADYPADSAQDLRGILERLVAEPSLLASWRSRLPRAKPWTEHAAEIEGVYDHVLSFRR
jgi:GT2 family glycosyltransferase/glycosyltransferase involved in cell wall biosynthesis